MSRIQKETVKLNTRWKQETQGATSGTRRETFKAEEKVKARKKPRAWVLYRFHLNRILRKIAPRSQTRTADQNLLRQTRNLFQNETCASGYFMAKPGLKVKG